MTYIYAFLLITSVILKLFIFITTVILKEKVSLKKSTVKIITNTSNYFIYGAAILFITMIIKGLLK